MYIRRRGREILKMVHKTSTFTGENPFSLNEKKMSKIDFDIPGSDAPKTAFVDFKLV